MARNSIAAAQPTRGPGRPRKTETVVLAGGLDPTARRASNAGTIRSAKAGGKPKATATKNAPPAIKLKTGGAATKVMATGKGGKGGKGMRGC